MARLLIAYGADVNAPFVFAYEDHFGIGMGGFTPAHLSAFFGDAAMLRLLLGSGAEVMPRDYWGRTPLHYAAMRGNVDAAEALLQHKAEIEARDIEGWAPLALAVIEGHRNVAAVLLAHGADAKWERDGRTLVDEAESLERYDLVELLTAFGADRIIPGRGPS